MQSRRTDRLTRPEYEDAVGRGSLPWLPRITSAFKQPPAVPPLSQSTKGIITWEGNTEIRIREEKE